MEIIAKQEYTDKYVSLYEGEIRNIPDVIANKLIEQNIVAEHSDSNPSGGEGEEEKNNNVVWIIRKDDSTSPPTLTLTMPVNEIAEAAYAGKPLGVVINGYEGENGLEVIGGQISTTYTIFDFPNEDTGGYLVLYTFPYYGSEGELQYYNINYDSNILYQSYKIF